MKVLWFTPDASNAALDFGLKSFRGGWISSLESMVEEEGLYELGICFFYTGLEFKKIQKGRVTYYGMPYEIGGTLKRIYQRQRGILNDQNGPYIDTVIKDFNPDLIHVFGTENGFGKLLIGKFEKVLFHLQGLTLPCSGVYFPLGISKRDILKLSSFNNILRGITFYHSFLAISQQAKREQIVVKYWKYFSGRTDYDRNYVKLLHPSITYFHCEEQLREEFSISKWSCTKRPNANEQIVIGTTINPNLYKGLDLVYKVVEILKDYNICWKIFGIAEDRELNVIIKKKLKIQQAVPSIKFYGQVPAATLIEELKTCQFFVHTSYIDNSSNAVCEAMLLGMPVVSSSVGGINSLITHKLNGFLYNPYDPFQLAGLLIYLVNNYDEALQVSTHARETAIKRHSKENILKTLNQMYETIYNN